MKVIKGKEFLKGVYRVCRGRKVLLEDIFI